MCFFFLFFSNPIYCLRPSILPPPPNSDPGSHRLFSPPTHYGSCLAFLSALSSLGWSYNDIHDIEYINSMVGDIYDIPGRIVWLGWGFGWVVLVRVVWNKFK